MPTSPVDLLDPGSTLPGHADASLRTPLLDRQAHRECAASTCARSLPAVPFRAHGAEATRADGRTCPAPRADSVLERLAAALREAAR
ncbi:hypothetical protein [Wenjunlia tyrosinilytica]|uniref:Uncharacterized protein n=1 Tax=Wenjunlia tyrosinilytica TaxID=1544741 RepID=A0A917ZEN7_9ACTN|nr:hypothetical protein [Wenjunlia tyrosinilytica]GGO81580.1 hypothetical protein GCM10012280_06190 [Wenjunlia tyrosinilytica]